MANRPTLEEVVPVLNDLQTKLVGENGAELFRVLKQVLCGEEPYPKALTFEVQKYVVDFDSTPYTPDNWEVLPVDEQLPNRVKGLTEVDLSRVDFHFDEGQKNGRVIKGTELRNNLKGVVVYGAQLLDFLLKKENQHLIPKEWKGKCVCFWGTIYLGYNHRLYVRCLFWDGSRWIWLHIWLKDVWNSHNPALVPASQK